MNYRMIGYVIGRILLAEAALMALPLGVALIYRESVFPYLLPMILLVFTAVLLGVRQPKNTVIYARDGFAVVALAWIAMSAFGGLPFMIAGDIPNFVDAFFETVSGFTTTGATILTDVEALCQSSLFWRSFTHWIGGMGVLVFVMAILPMNDGHGMHLMRAEVPGPTVGKLVSKMRDTAKILYLIYGGMTVIEIVLLLLGGMSLYDACIHAFGTAGTGGFSNMGASVGYYDSVYIDVVISIFMLLFGVNFNLYYFLLIGKFRDVFSSEELRAYVGIVAAAVLAIAANITYIYGNFFTGVRYSLFQVASVVTTTGYATADFNLWPAFSKTILVLLMFMGACAGSTGGGLKVARVVILVKAAYADMKKMLHPNSIATVRVEGKPINDKNIRSCHAYITVYLLILVVSTLLLSLEEFDLVTTFTAVVACFNNIGPGLELVGPTGNFAMFSWASKLLLSFDMLAGRLELFPMLLLFAPSIWSRKQGNRVVRRFD